MIELDPPPVDFDAARVDQGDLSPLQLKRETTVREHMDSENRHEIDVAFGTFEHPRRGLPPTGRTYRCRQAVFFLFEDDRLVCERVYFDAITMLRQLGLADDPNSMRGRLTAVLTHPGTVVRAVRRNLATRRAARR